MFETIHSCTPQFKVFRKRYVSLFLSDLESNSLVHIMSRHSIRWNLNICLLAKFRLKWWDGWVPQSILLRNPCFWPAPFSLPPFMYISRSQQGRFHFVIDTNEAKNPRNTEYRVLPLSFGSTTIRRVCGSTLQAETYALQHGLEAGDKLRGVIAELKGQIRSRQSRMCIPHLPFTDCWSLADHLAAEIPARVQDKRLGIELMAIHDNLWRDGQKTWNSMKNGGDCIEWISTSTMILDFLTKSLKPEFMLRVVKENVYKVQKRQPKR